METSQSQYQETQNPAAQYYEAQEQMLSDRSNQLYQEALHHSGGNFPLEYLQETVRRLAVKEMYLDERERQLMVYIARCNRGGGGYRGQRSERSRGGRGRGGWRGNDYRGDRNSNDQSSRGQRGGYTSSRGDNYSRGGRYRNRSSNGENSGERYNSTAPQVSTNSQEIMTQCNESQLHVQDNGYGNSSMQEFDSVENDD